MDIQQIIHDIKANGTYRTLKNITQVSGKYITINKTNYINFTSNDYLGIGQFNLNLESFQAFSKQFSHTLSSSRLISGNSVVYSNLEKSISQSFGFEDCFITNSGYDANLAVFNIFKDEDVVVFSDQKNHASIIDGIKLSDLNKVIYQHLDYTALEMQLQQYPFHTKLIVSDSVFSTNGNIVDLQHLINLKNKYSNTLLIIDDSHGLGLNFFKSYQGIDILTSSLSKAWGAHGGVILSSKDIKTLIINKGRAVIYSSGLPIFNLYHVMTNFQYVINCNTRREKLLDLSRYFNEQYQVLFNHQVASLSPIKNIILPCLKSTEKVHTYLYDNGLFTSLLRYPTVEVPTLRISLSYFHSKKDIDVLLRLIKNYIQGVV
ncbi:pyridoxal phosphate-dependent aminotransferase family protein [Staphylococcus casei]|uniref:aminotransferase class I/II-fold pyridoxal phosphate-dependent enzyme n=1 Tax=Staphylococcus TaxID=1279 RepID=UPI000D1EC3EC|nr:pyridoxal phosphate-dependent aminotransferase family protein [Staphylococcus casei]PTI77800.1 8-amino-7-oxononanoate synthase [Staphylococcus succinus]WJE86232.1 pyridoxal phosphate-dependent aminotransferase family protein [Staphylococcus casei]